MRKEDAIALNNRWIAELNQSIFNHEEVIKGLEKRIELFENNIAKMEKED